MKTIYVLFFVAWASGARVNKEKRGVYADAYYGHPGFFPDFNVNSYQPKKLIFPGSPTYSYRVPQITYDANFGSFLPKFEQTAYNYQPQVATLTNQLDSGYNYPVPIGPKLEEGPIPKFFDFLIPPAIRPVPIPNAKLEPGLRAPMRRILTAANEGLFYRYPGYIPEPGLTVRLPIPMARPTRIVVPQHGPIAFGSGGLSYSALPGGRFALGSGGRALANLAMARANPLPPNNQLQQPPQPKRNPTLIYPGGFTIYQRSVDAPAPSEVSSNSLTVFPLPDDQKNNPLG